MGISIGELDRRIVIKKVVQSQDATGGLYNTVTNLTVWAKVEFGGGKEKDEGGVIIADGSIKFTVHYRTVTLNDWIEWKGKKYDIIRIEEVGRNEFLLIHCNENSQ